MATKLFGIAGAALLFYIAIVLLFAGCQQSLIYYPRTAPEQQQLQRADATGMQAWRDEDEALTGWKRLATVERDGSTAILVFHGNAGYALHRTYYVDLFRALPGGDARSVYLFEYPGYGAREGKPSEATIFEAAHEAAELLFRAAYDRIILVGESLGSGPAAWLAGQYPENIAGLILVTPFTNLADVGRHHFPFLPVDALLRERYDNMEALAKYGGPVAFMLAERDETVPAALGESLHDGYDGPKLLVVQPGANHNTLSFDPMLASWRAIIDFLEP